VNTCGNIVITNGIILDLGWPKAAEAKGTETEFQNRPQAQNWFGRREIDYGWPSKLLHTSIPIALKKHEREFYFMDMLREHRDVEDYFVASSKQWVIKGVVINAIVALFVLFTVALLCEYLIRR